jgi:large subunit ribosomal protein L9
MDVILLERIEQLGQMGDVVSVKPGFARNFLFPKKKALRASKGNLEKFEGQRKELEAENLTRKGEAVDIAARMEGLQVVVIRSAGEAGQLYGSVNARDVCAAVSEAGFRITRNQVVIERPVKMLGLFGIRVRLHPEVDAIVSVNVARSVDEAEQQKKLGRAIMSQDDEDRQADEEARVAALATAEAMFDPEAQAKVAQDLAQGEDEENAAEASTEAQGDVSEETDEIESASEEAPEATPDSAEKQD